MSIEISGLGPTVTSSLTSREVGKSETQIQTGTSDTSMMKQHANNAASNEAASPVDKQKIEELEKQVQELQDAMSLKGWAINFSVDKNLSQTIIKVMDAETKTMIRQIPSEEWVSIAKRLREYSDDMGGKTKQIVAGLLLDNRI
ncbi:flagellar protein FlaG [Aeromonas caviae]|uniref:flagellar protein FlaG n=1 Tax=Aeromonas caviae TaxID=648 RepID=UPI0029DCEA88|nr:flagellar protein FlaG [Aeromonas caviae]MDX7821205.1 flagellar protein FlaG [Aeromonas caviae]